MTLRSVPGSVFPVGEPSPASARHFSGEVYLKLLIDFFYLNGNFCSAGVDRIFDELLDDRIGTVDDLSRRDLIIDAGRKNIDLHLYFSFHSDMSASACIGVSRLTSISRSSSARPESGSGADGSSSSGI